MARTIAQIQQSIIDAKNADATLSELDSSSDTAVWLRWSYIVALCQWTLEVLFDRHKAALTAIINSQSPHTTQWYEGMAKKFQYGDSLPTGSDTYTVIDSTKQIVSYSAAVELTRLVRIKVAKLTAGVLAPLSGGELTAFTAYMGRIKDAGVRLQLTSGNGDNLQLALSIYYDPLVLDNTGARLDGTAATPVKDAINAFLADLTFNGLFVINRLEAAILAVEGVRVEKIGTIQANYGATPYVAIDHEYVPDAGYLVLDDTYFNANITYTAHGAF